MSYYDSRINISNIMITIEHWGLTDYNEAWARQKELQADVQQGRRDSTLVFCEHPSVITIGRNGGPHNILPEAAERGIPVLPVNRGGDVTLHNPGQLVGYPVFRLSDFREDLHWFLREIEQCIIETIAESGIAGSRVEGLTGVWVGGERKICAIGIHCSRWVTSHGFALNVNNNLSEFATIIPCGITNKAVTSMTAEIQLPVSLAEVRTVCEQIFTKKFQ